MEIIKIIMSEKLAALGFDITVEGLTAGVDEKQWPHIAYVVTLLFKGKLVLHTPYKMGVGHVDPKKARAIDILFTKSESSLLYSWQSKPFAQFKDKQLWSQVACKLAKQQKVKPVLAEVISSLFLDSSPHFNHETFEDWCGNFGCDTDSRKAEAMYRICLDTGIKIASRVPQNIIEEAQEIVKDL